VVDIDKEIFLLQKNLFDLKLKKFTSQNVKPHLFTHTKHRLSQLEFKKACLVKKEK
jgi:ribosomal protein L29